MLRFGKTKVAKETFSGEKKQSTFGILILITLLAQN